MPLRQKDETQKKVEPVKGLPALHTLRVMLAGHSDYIMLRVPKDEHDRVMRIIQNNAIDTFILIECLEEVVAVRLKDLALVNFCFDYGADLGPEPDTDDQLDAIQLLFRGCTEPLPIEVDPDRPSIPGDEENLGQLDNLLYMLELSDGGEGTTHFLEDIDGEPVVILEHSLAMVRIPMCLIPAWADRKRAEGDSGEDDNPEAD